MDYTCIGVDRNVGRTKGFTLVELLVVIAIIAILAGLIFPVFVSVRRKAKQAPCLSNLRQLGMAIQMYAGDYGGFPVVRIFEGGEGNPYGNWAGCYIYGGVCDLSKGQIYPYVNSASIYLCPSARGVKKNIFPDALPYPLSYSMNALLSYKRIVASASRVGLLIHEDSSTIDDGDFNWMGWAGDPDEGRNQPSNIHNEGTCVVYCDLHAEWQNYDTVIRALTNNDWDPDKH